MITGLAHTAVCVPDVDAAVRWYETVLGLRVLSTGIADVAGVRTTWFRDPWGITFILVEKHHADRPYWRQHRP